MRATIAVLGGVPERSNGAVLKTTKPHGAVATLATAGGVAERSKATALKVVEPAGSVGSNPTPAVSTAREHRWVYLVRGRSRRGTRVAYRRDADADERDPPVIAAGESAMPR
jgi:hypothetical protein